MSTSWVEHKTITECLRAYEEQELGLISDIAKHGCQGGVTGIIYYDETSAFHTRHEKEIWDELYEAAQQEGLKIMDLVHRIAPEAGSITQVKNDLAWWAVEVVASRIIHERAGAAA